MPNLLKLGSAVFGSGLSSLSLFKKQSHARMDCDNQQMFSSMYPENTKWFADWDGLQQNMYDKSEKPTGVRNLLFISNAQHKLFGQDQGLTKLGEQQAAEVGKFLKRLKNKYSLEQMELKVITASEQFSFETATIAMNTAQFQGNGEQEGRLNAGNPLEPSPMLPFGPTSTDPRERAFFNNTRKQKIDEKRKQIDEYFADNISRKENNTSTFELYFCHANIINFLSMKLLQLPLNAWNRFDTLNCSVTWFKIKPDGKVSCITFGNYGFLPQHMWTEK